MENRILLEFDEKRFAGMMQKIQSVKISIERAVEEINSISSFKMNGSALHDILNSHGYSAANQMEKAIDKDLTSSVAHSATLRQLAKQGDMEKFHSLLKSFPKPDPSMNQYLTISEEGKVEITANAEEAIREDCSTFINTSRGSEVYQAQQAMIKAMNDFMKICPTFRSSNIASSYKLVYGEGRVVPTELAYDRL